MHCNKHSKNIRFLFQISFFEVTWSSYISILSIHNLKVPANKKIQHFALPIICPYLFAYPKCRPLRNSDRVRLYAVSQNSHPTFTTLRAPTIPSYKCESTHKQFLRLSAPKQLSFRFFLFTNNLPYCSFFFPPHSLWKSHWRYLTIVSGFTGVCYFYETHKEKRNKRKKKFLPCLDCFHNLYWFHFAVQSCESTSVLCDFLDHLIDFLP